MALAVAEKALEFEHRDLHWGNVLISRTKEQYIYYNLGGREIKFPSKGVKVCSTKNILNTIKTFFFIILLNFSQGIYNRFYAIENVIPRMLHI